MWSEIIHHSPVKYFKAIPAEKRNVYEIKDSKCCSIGTVNVDTGQIVFTRLDLYIHQLADLTKLVQQLIKTSL